MTLAIDNIVGDGRPAGQLAVADPRFPVSELVRGLVTNGLRHEEAIILVRNLGLDDHPADGPFASARLCYAAEDENRLIASLPDAYPAGTTLFCSSRFAQAAAVDLGASYRAFAIGYGVDHWERTLPADDWRVEGRSFRFLHWSNCDERSGISLLLDTFGEVFDVADDVSLLICVDAMGIEAVRAQVAARRALDTRYPHLVVIADPGTDAARSAMIAQCHAFVAPYSYTELARPLLRCALAGMPVIATSRGGHMDFCDDSSTWLVQIEFVRDLNNFASRGIVSPSKIDLREQLWKLFRTVPEERVAKADINRRRLLKSQSWRDVARRLLAAVRHEADRSRVEPSTPTISWVTRWNAQCGISTYSEHLLSSRPRQSYVVLAAHESVTTSPDEYNVFRTWHVGKEKSGLPALMNVIDGLKVEAVILHHNYGFYNHHELAELLIALSDRDVPTLVFLHSTIDPGGSENYRMQDLIDALVRCDRVVVHSVADMNRLARIGVQRNLLLLPHGALGQKAAPTSARAPAADPLLVTFGFVFATKGLIEIIHAVDLLCKGGFPVRLRMLNAEYATPDSHDLCIRIRALIASLGLGQRIEFISSYLSDEVAFSLIRDADLFVNPYQRSNESASGAVRYGLAAGIATAVTPLPFFDDLGASVFRMSDTDPASLASSIEHILGAIQQGTPEVVATAQAAERWRAHHDFGSLSARLANIAAALVEQRQVEQVKSVGRLQKGI